MFRANPTGVYLDKGQVMIPVAFKPDCTQIGCRGGWGEGGADSAAMIAKGSGVSPSVDAGKPQLLSVAC